MIVKLKCIDNYGNIDVTAGKVYAGLRDVDGFYVIRNDVGYFTFVDIDDLHSTKWEIVE